MNIHASKMAGPLLPLSRFCGEVGCVGSLSPHPLPPSLSLTLISIMENKPVPTTSASRSAFCFPLTLPNLCTQRATLCLTPLPPFPNPPKIHSGVIFQPPRSCLFPPTHTHTPPLHFYLCAAENLEADAQLKDGLTCFLLCENLLLSFCP